MTTMRKSENICAYRAESESDWNDGMAYVSGVYRSGFGVDPSAPDELFFVRENGAVTGTLGVIFAHDGSLAILRRHGCGQQQSDGVEICRWASSNRHSSALLLNAALGWLALRNTLTGWCEQGRSINRLTRSLGIDLVQIPGTRLDMEMVEPQHRAFYLQHVIALYRLSVPQAGEAISRYIARYL